MAVISIITFFYSVCFFCFCCIICCWFIKEAPFAPSRRGRPFFRYAENLSLRSGLSRSVLRVLSIGHRTNRQVLYLKLGWLYSQLPQQAGRLAFLVCRSFFWISFSARRMSPVFLPMTVLPPCSFCLTLLPQVPFQVLVAAGADAGGTHRVPAALTLPFFFGDDDLGQVVAVLSAQDAAPPPVFPELAEPAVGRAVCVVANTVDHDVVPIFHRTDSFHCLGKTNSGPDLPYPGKSEPLCIFRKDRPKKPSVSWMFLISIGWELMFRCGFFRISGIIFHFFLFGLPIFGE